ncbi:MAG: hypothetical protein Q7T71_07255 [Herbiconiux sp.]|nr:hypothetical protein [Herbiconiux sp.]
MTDLTFSGPAFAPEPIARSSSPKKPVDAESRAQFSRLAVVPFGISVGVNVVFFVGYFVPELGGASWLTPVYDQLSALVARDLTTPGVDVSALQTGHDSVAAAIVLIATAVLAFAARRAGGYRLAVWPAAVAVAVAAVWIVVATLLRGQILVGATGAGLAAIAAGVALVVARRSADHPDASPHAQKGLGTALKIYAFSLVIPLAVGRALFSPWLAQAAQMVSVDPFPMSMSALVTWATPLLYVAGLSAGVVGWSILTLLPPWAGKRILVTAIWLIVAVGGGLVIVGAQARVFGDQRAYEMTAMSPHGELNGCGAWWLEATPQQTIALSGDGCRTVTAYTGYVATATQTADVDFAFSGELITPEGISVYTWVAAALYERVLVTIGSTPDSAGPNVIRGLSLDDASTRWIFSCPDEAPFAARFAGVPGGDDPELGRITGIGEAAGVYVVCPPAGNMRVDPATGALSPF